MARIDAWTMEQDDLLAAEWGAWPDEDVARWLGRTVTACATRAAVIGIRKRDNWAKARQRKAAPVTADVRGWRRAA